MPQSLLDDGKYLFVRRIGNHFLFAVLFRIEARIAERRFPRTDALQDLLAHAIAASLFSDCILVFRGSGKHRLDEFLRGLVANRLGYGMQGCAVVQKNFPYGEMVLGISCEAIHAQNHERMDLVFPFPAEFQSGQKLFPVIQAQVLRRFSLLPENLDNLNVPLGAVALAEILLEFERGAFHLLVA